MGVGGGVGLGWVRWEGKGCGIKRVEGMMGEEGGG